MLAEVYKECEGHIPGDQWDDCLHPECLQAMDTVLQAL